MWQDFIPIAIAIAVPAIATAIGVIRYFWKKEKCFIAMKNKIIELSEHDGEATEEHNGYEERLKIIEENQVKWIIYLKLLLKDRKIDYSD